MILITNDRMLEIFLRLNVRFNTIEKKRIRNYKFVSQEETLPYLESCQGEQEEITLVELDQSEIWKTDKLWNCFRYKRTEILVEETEMMAYFKRSQGYDFSQDNKVEEIAECLKKERQLDTSDLYLMIPGKLEKDKNKKEEFWNQLVHKPHELFEIFSENLENCIRSEYYHNFADSLKRKCLGEIVLEINDHIEKRIFRQNAMATIVKHETGLCILEICVYNCSIGGNKLLNYYCADEVIYIVDGQRYKRNELMKLLNIRSFGQKRSMVFAYGNVSDEAVTNALANEEYPMGKVGGIFGDIVKKDNIAQYDTAEVFVSSATMIERCKNMTNPREWILDCRIAYHAIEIFFVELILLQDASIEKIYYDVKKEQALQETETDMEEALERYEQIGFDMGKTLNFSDYDQFIFPTTRASAKKVADRFGIERIYEKYETNRQLLGSMIQSNKRQMEFKYDKVKNGFLMVISGLALLGTLGESLYNIFESRESGIAGYGIAVITIIIGYILYNMVMYLYNNKIKKVKKGDEKEI